MVRLFIRQIQLDDRCPKELSFLDEAYLPSMIKKCNCSDILNIRTAFQRKLLDKGLLTSQAL